MKWCDPISSYIHCIESYKLKSFFQDFLVKAFNFEKTNNILGGKTKTFEKMKNPQNPLKKHQNNQKRLKIQNTTFFYKGGLPAFKSV